MMPWPSSSALIVSPEVTTGTPVAAMSLMVLRPGWLAGSHIRICGLMVSCEVTATVGWLAAREIASSVLTAPRTIESSRYISAGTGWNPTFGPPGRTSMSTPVSTPCATSDPFTDLAPASTVWSDPTSAYMAPCSASGCQSCCITTVSGQPAALRSSGPPAGAAGTPAAPPAGGVAGRGLPVLRHHAGAGAAGGFGARGAAGGRGGPSRRTACGRGGGVGAAATAATGGQHQRCGQDGRDSDR